MDWWPILNTILERYRWRGPKHISKDPFKTLIGCILSQRTRDETTDAAFERLFSKYKGVEDLSKADPAEIEKLIYPVGFYRVKARRIVEAARFIRDVFGGKVPDNMEDLLRIPGVGRKCANIVLAYGFGKPAIAVDTHVYRVSKRLGIVSENADVVEVEETLKRIVPKERWIDVNHALVRFGKDVCRPTRPLCEKCPVREHCTFYLTSNTLKRDLRPRISRTELKKRRK